MRNLCPIGHLLIGLFISTFILCQHNMWAQDKMAVDSLQRIISGNYHDSVKADAYLSLAGEWLNVSPQQAIPYADQGLIHAKKANSSGMITNALGWLAYLHEQTGALPKALQYNEEALQLARQYQNIKDEAILLNNIAAIYKDRGELDTALSLNQQSLALRKEISDTIGIATTYNNLALILQGQGKIEEALDHFTLALTYFENKRDAEGMATALQNIGAIYKAQKEYGAALQHTRRSLAISLADKDSYSAGFALNSLGSIYESNQQLDSALHYFQQALQLRTAIDDQQGQAYTLKNLGGIFEKQQQYAAAEEAYQKSILLFEALEDKWGESKSNQMYGALLLNLGKLAPAETHLEHSIRLARELGYPADISAAALSLQKLYRKKGEWQKALVYYDEYVLMHDSIQNDNNRKAAIKTQFRYEYEKREAILKSDQEKQNALNKAELRRQKLIRNVTTWGFLIVLIFALVILLQRNRIAREKKRSEALLLNILPREIAEELKAKGEAEARQFDSVTVLFTDFKDFTIHSESWTPKDLVSELNMCFKAFDEIVTRHHLEKIKTVGDAYLAVAGLPIPHPDHAANAVNAAIEMRDFIHRRRIETEGRSFEIRCGVHSGTVVAGIVGVKKYAYDIWGDTVNTAARMEQNSEPGKINISGATFDLVHSNYHCTHRGKIEAKNKGSIDMYFVEAKI